MNELALFAGAGGGILGGKLLGWRTVCAVEWDAYAASILVARQNDGCLATFPIWDDVRTFDGRLWRGRVDVVSGGFPCQDISSAGRGAGIDGERSGMWAEMARIIGEVRPRYVFVENSPMLTSRGLGRVLGDLAAMGYDARWGVLGAHHVGAPHKRDRIWILGHAQGFGAHSDKIHSADVLPALAREKTDSAFSAGERQKNVADTDQNNRAKAINRSGRNGSGSRSGGWWNAEPDVGRVAHGVAHWVDRLRCIGNGQVPAVVALAWRTLAAQVAHPSPSAKKTDP